MCGVGWLGRFVCWSVAGWCVVMLLLTVLMCLDVMLFCWQIGAVLLMCCMYFRVLAIMWFKIYKPQYCFHQLTMDQIYNYSASTHDNRQRVNNTATLHINTSTRPATLIEKVGAAAEDGWFGSGVCCCEWSSVMICCVWGGGGWCVDGLLCRWLWWCWDVLVWWLVWPTSKEWQTSPVQFQSLSNVFFHLVSYRQRARSLTEESRFRKI